MRYLVFGALGVGVALAAALATVPGAAASAAPEPVGSRPVPAQTTGATARTCFSQRDHDAFGYVVSTNFEPEMDIYDSQAADDFVLTTPCPRPVISIDGTYGEGTGSADTFNVTIYRARNNGPGKVERLLDGVAYDGTCGDGLGCAEIDLGKRLKPGRWWLSVQANISFSETGSYWGWWTNLTVRNAGAMWQNP